MTGIYETPLTEQTMLDVAWRSRAPAAGGTRAFLETFRPMVTWREPVMEVDHPVDRDLHLDGRGLLLVPVYFCWRRPITLVDETLPPVLIYPADKSASTSELAAVGDPA